MLHRLLAGLGINSEELYLLIQHLAGPLDLVLSGPEQGTFMVNITTLSILYRHSRMLRVFKLTIPEFFFLIRINPAITENFIQGLHDIIAFIELVTWWKVSDYTLPELSYLLSEPLPDGNEYPDPETMAYNIRSSIDANRDLLFADTLFAYFEGITEAQSRAIIRANNRVIVKADLRKYRISPNTTDPSTFSITLPPDIDSTFSPEQRIQVIASVLKIIAENLMPVYSPFPGDALEHLEGISTGQSRLIFEANTALFDSAGSSEFRIAAAVKTDPSRVGLTIPVPVWTDMSPAEQGKLYAVMLERIMRYMQPGAPEISDRVFAGIAGLTLDQSRSILAANPGIFEEVENDALYWLSPGFDPGTLITIPVDVPLPAASAQELLLTKHVGEILLDVLGSKLEINAGKVRALAFLAGYDFRSASFSSLITTIVQGREALTVLEDIIIHLQKLKIWFKDPIFNAETLTFITRNSVGHDRIFQITSPGDYRSPGLHHIRITELYRRLRKSTGDSGANIHKALTAYLYDGSPPGFSPEGVEYLSVILKAEPGIINSLNNVVRFPAPVTGGEISNRALEALDKCRELLELVQYLGIGSEALPLFISMDYDQLATAVKAVVTAIRTKYDSEEEWEMKIGPFEDSTREKKRDTLTDYLLHSFQSSIDAEDRWFKTSHDLYNYFLIDTELEGCARISRVVAGISSLQLYIQRCLMNLEKDHPGSEHDIVPGDIPADQWEWRKNYRVWEVNRKIFFYAENNIEPDLRDNKTELFIELESGLLQQDIDAQNALDAYSRYMKGFNEIASLKIAGAYHDTARQTSH